MSFTPSGGPSVTTKAASSITSTSARLNGTVNPNGLATTYYFDYGTSTAYGSKTAVATAGSGTTAKSVSATVTGLGPGVHHFRLVATSSAGTSTGGDLTFGSAGPPVVQTGSAQGASTTGVTLTGSVNPSGNATNWYFEYGTSDVVPVEDGVEERRLGKRPDRRLGGDHEARGRDDLPLPPRRDEQRRHRLRQRRHVHDRGRAHAHRLDVAGGLRDGRDALGRGLEPADRRPDHDLRAGDRLHLLLDARNSVLTGAGGAWSFLVRPKIQTSYKASASDGASSISTIGVRPAVSLRVITGGRFSTRVVAGSSFAGKTVQLQRLLPGNRWKTLAKAKLSSKSSAVFSTKVLPKGTSLIRVAMSVNQAGRGYLGAFSRTATFHRY